MISTILALVLAPLFAYLIFKLSLSIQALAYAILTLTDEAGSDSENQTPPKLSLVKKEFS